MSSDFTTRLVRDSRLNDISSQVEVAVSQGANQASFISFSPSSASSSSLSFSIQPPSESVIVDRNLLLQCTVNFTITIGRNVPVGTNCFLYGQREAFQAFPLNSLFTTTSATINNTTVSCNTSEILGVLLHLMDEEDFAKDGRSMSPYLIDRYQRYSDAMNASNNPLAGFKSTGYNQHRVPRGAHPLNSVNIRRLIPGGGEDNNPISQSVDDTWVIEVSATFCEPLFLSPFLFHSRYNEAGLLGVNNIALVMNLDAQCSRFWSTGLQKLGAGGNPIDYTVSLNQNEPLTGAKILVSILTSQATDLLPSRNSVPFCDYPRYITSQINAEDFLVGTPKRITLNNLQLNQVPEKLIIVARKRRSEQKPRDCTSFFAINSVSLNFNASSGLLSSCSQYELWRMSVANGSKQSWYEFSGSAQVYDAASGNVKVNTCGSVLVLDPSRDLSLPAYLAPGSLGQFSLQLDMDITNISDETLKPEVMIITQNSGIFTCQAGSSKVETGILNKQIVVDTSTEDGANAISSNEYNRMRGGALGDQIASALKHLPLVKRHLGGKSRSAGSYDGAARMGGMLPKNKLDALTM